MSCTKANLKAPQTLEQELEDVPYQAMKKRERKACSST